ncbi:hypothetical protein BURPSPAST_AA0717 [Burkholderia pseudomallei Pasteur 52237]|nr:hypothetical protein BURPSPAST_AA0717 [Burkholderia pseudomallei Pasteur 52237]
MASISGTRWVTSFRFAPVGIAAIGVPLVSMAMWCFGRGALDRWDSGQFFARRNRTNRR